MNPVPKVLAYAPALLWAALLLYLGSRSFDTLELPELVPAADKLAHFGLYGMLGVLAAMGWRWAGQWPAAIWPLLAALLIGLLDELQQRGVPSRTAEVADWLVDAAAIALAFLALGRRTSSLIRTE